MIETTIDPRCVAEARECFLEARECPGLPVRTGIVESWRRSRLSGVDSAHLDPPYFDDLDTDGRLIHAARPVLDRLQEKLSDAATSLLLTDAYGRILDRRVEHVALAICLDHLQLAPGFGYGEESVGTNGIGTAIEARQVTAIFGTEHFTERLHAMACAGAPVHDPLTGRLVGLIDVTCWAKDANPLMAALASEAADDIEQRLLELGSERERALLTAFLGISRRGGAVVTVSDDLIIANQHAAHLLEPTDHTVVRDKVAELSRASQELVEQVMLARGDMATIRVRPVRAQTEGAGAVVEIQVAPDARPPRHLVRPFELRLAGSSHAFSKACTDLETHCRNRTWVLLEGEPGVGKLALTEAVHRSHGPASPFAVIQPQDLAEDRAACLRRMSAAIGVPGATVVLRYPERYPRQAIPALLEWMRAASGHPGRPWVVATTYLEAEPPEDLLSTLAVTLTVPALRHRIEDVRDLVPVLLRRISRGGSVSCSPAAMRVLLRYSWPGNVTELLHALRFALTRRRIGEIQPQDLPEVCHVTSRRVLTPWEAIERDAIIRTLQETDGDKALAAHLLGISRATIYRKINAYGISVDGR
ncbi:helix-turn-helix domain-containing protein [Actinoallomurus sp. NPDC050550]|uniref:sigma-54-dependent Fis family transcriptional regulator n=1 Tax=Actinoallomurus sp. NPDC050550 TaxID=3154937 RepID=UPI0033C8937A